MLYLAHKKNMQAQLPLLDKEINARLNSSEDGDGSLLSNTTSNSTLNENDPLLMFLHHSIHASKATLKNFTLGL
jgi:hypothetical protein